MLRRKVASTVVAICLAVAVSPAFAARGGGGNASIPASCVASGMSVHATGLPTDELVNFMLSDASGTRGWVLGYTPDGSWLVSVPLPNGPTTYEFASRTYGKEGSKYRVFATCTA